jgi:hypothetical protein
MPSEVSSGMRETSRPTSEKKRPRVSWRPALKSPSSCVKSWSSSVWRKPIRSSTRDSSAPRSGSLGRGGGTLCRGGNCGQLREASARSEVGRGRVAAQDVRSRRLQDANSKNPIRFSLHRQVFRLSRRPSAALVAAQPSDGGPPQPRPSSEPDGQACMESGVEGAPDSGRRRTAGPGRQAAAGSRPQRLVGKSDRPRGLAVRPAAKGRGGRPGGGP